MGTGSTQTSQFSFISALIGGGSTNNPVSDPRSPLIGASVLLARHRLENIIEPLRSGDKTIIVGVKCDHLKVRPVDLRVMYKHMVSHMIRCESIAGGTTMRTIDEDFTLNSIWKSKSRQELHDVYEGLPRIGVPSGGNCGLAGVCNRRLRMVDAIVRMTHYCLPGKNLNANMVLPIWPELSVLLI